jgi:hypothetical protein
MPRPESTETLASEYVVLIEHLWIVGYNRLVETPWLESRIQNSEADQVFAILFFLLGMWWKISISANRRAFVLLNSLEDW